jgi:MSHA type pilus biogenesis protein MshL
VPNFHNLLKKFLTLSLVLTQFSCVQGKLDPFDLQNGLTRDEIKDSLMKAPDKKSEKKQGDSKNEAPIPKVSKLIITPPPPVIGGSKTLSFSVTEQVPLKDVLIELGRVAQIDVDLDPSISGGVIINAKNRPFKEVIDRISALGSLRYTFQNGVLHFERDAPYMKNYFVDYLIDGQLWSDVETNVNAILANSTLLVATPQEGEAAAPTAASSISSNKSAGILSVFATGKEHDMIADYLADVEQAASAQVLIEAKVVEVGLNEAYQTGIDWTSIGKQNTISATNGFLSGSAGITYIATELFSSDLAASVSALETFGSTRTISSPRIHAINNQKASLNFGDKLVYFKVDASQTTTAATTGEPLVSGSITSTKQEEEIGVQLDITPSINVRTGQIVMNIKPTLSVVSGEVVDPAAAVNKIPVVNKRTVDTIAKIKSGDVMVIGGLMTDTTKNSDSGVPFLSRIPLLGWFFKSVSKDTKITETVIFIKATIIKQGSTAVSKIDRDMQQKFDTNRRRFFGVEK